MSSPFAEAPPRRRLTIAHLMLWTLGCAIALGLQRANSLTNQADNRLSIFLQYYFLLYSIHAGARIGAVLLFGWVTWRGDRSFPSQPGHWLLLNEGVGVLLLWLESAAIRLFAGDREASAYWIAAQVPSAIVTAALYAIALREISREDLPSKGPSVLRSGKGWRLIDVSRTNRIWKVAFWLLLLDHAVAAFTFGILTTYFLAVDVFSGPIPWYLTNFNACCPPIFLLLLPVACVTDPHRSRRDFLHWSGVSAAVATDLLTLSFRWVITHWR